MAPSSTKLAGAVALIALLGSANHALAQAEDHEAHHPEGSAAQIAQAQDQPATAPTPQPGQGMMGMTPQMMQQMRDMMMGGQTDGMEPGMMPRGEMMGTGPGMMGSGMMGPGMMGPAMMGPGMMMGHQGMMGTMMRVMFALMDADGDGSLSRDEFAEAHDRIFNHMDADGDGELTLQEMQSFLSGPRRPMLPEGEPANDVDEEE
jgi:hypothetical protein